MSPSFFFFFFPGRGGQLNSVIHQCDLSGKCGRAGAREIRIQEGHVRSETDRAMFATAARWAAKKGKPKMAPIELTAPPEQAQSITRTIFDVVREHGPLTISDVWDHVKDVGLRGLTSKRQMKIMLRWMRERQKLRLICDHDGPHKQFLYTTWFTNPKNAPQRPKPELKAKAEKLPTFPSSSKQP